MSWLFSQALVAEYLEATSSDGAPSAQLSGNPTQLAYLPPDRMTAFSRLSRFGMTFRPLTADRGEALLTLYRAAFLVKTSPQPDAEQALTASDQECGERWPGWLAKFDPSTSSLKTPQCSLFEEEPELLQTLPRSGTTVAGTLWEQQTLVHRISETDFGLSVPTPTVYDSTGNGNPRKDSNGAEGGRHGVSLHHFITMWPTPTVCGNYNRKGASATSGDGLATAVQKWPTPVCQDSRHAISRHLDPNNQNWKSNLGEVVMSLEPTSNGRLNPTWVEWLMGWPLGWTDLKPLEMDKFQQWQQQRFKCFADNDNATS